MHQTTRGLRLGILGLLISLGLGNASGENVGFVRRQGTQLELNGKTFYFNSSSQYYLFYKPQAAVDEVMADAAGLGLNAFRVWGFCDGTPKEGYVFQPSPGVYDESTFQKMDYILYKANQHNIRLVIALVNNWDDFGGMNQYVAWSGPAQSHDDFYTDASCRAWYKNYVSAFLNRVNIYTGVKYKDDPTVLMWELANEPRCQSDATGNKLQIWIDEMAAHIKSIDPVHLVSTGSEGWYKTAGATNWKYNGGEGVDYIRNHQSPWIDVCSFHMYPNDWGMNEAESLTWIQEHVTDAHAVVGKPVFAGEFGWKADRDASGAVVLADFSSGTDNFQNDWGFSSIGRVSSPSFNGNGSLRGRVNLRPSASNAGIRKDYATPQNFLSYGQLGAWVYLPSGSPADLKAEFYVKSGTSWLWADGADVTLLPGNWVQVKITAADITSWGGSMDDIRQIGIQVKRGNTNYNGFVHFDLFEGGQPAESPMAARNRIYGDWYDQFDLTDSDGAGFWILSGHVGSALYPDYDDYTVYYPEDSGTAPVIQSYSGIVAAKNTDSLASPSLWDGCETVGAWTAAVSYSDAQSLSPVTGPVSEGSGAIQISYGAPVWGKAYLETAGPGGAGLDQDWNVKRAIAIDLHNPGGPTTVTVAVSTSSNWIWHESIPQPLHPGWNTVVFHLDENTWKSAATGWQNNGPVTNLSQVKRISIGVFGYGGPGVFHVDNIRLF